jgi:ligand-binding SRPBCC domain-containing protein
VSIIQLETVIHAPIQDCFDVSLSVDAHTASMAASGERVVGGVSTGLMSLGDTVTWRARHFGIPFRMTSMITSYDRPARFIDEQQTGPFRRWQHEHRFAALGDRETLMIDEVDFRSPVGPIGRAVDHLILQRYMSQLLRGRNRWIKLSLESP